VFSTKNSYGVNEKMNGKDRFTNKLNIFKENFASARVGVLIISLNVVFIILSAVLISVLPENTGHSVPELLRLAFTLMVNPSGKYVYSEAPISLIITTVVVLLGMISLTGGTVGFITSYISDFLAKTAHGKTQLHLKNHIVILNYNNKVPSIIFDYCFDDMKNTYITILTREDKQTVLDEIENMYNQKDSKKRFKNIIVRSGNPMSKIDLDKINIKDARTVLIMTPKPSDGEVPGVTEDRSFEVSKLFMFVTWYFTNIKSEEKANIVVETSSSNMEKMVKEYKNENNNQIAVPVDYNEITGKMLAIISIMPSLNGVMKQLFSFEGVEIYIKDAPDKISLEDEYKCNTSVVPLFDNDGKRVYIAEDEDEIGNMISPVKLKKAPLENPFEPRIVFEKKEIIIVGVNCKLHHILESLACFKKKYNNEELHVILAGVKDEEEKLKEIYVNPKYTGILMPEKYHYIIVSDIYNPMADLGEVTSDKADSIIFLSDDNASSIHIDEKPLIYWTNLKKSLRSNKNVDVIVEILDSQNMSIIELKNKDQIIVSDDFLGHLYAQLGKTPERLDVLKDMITSEGANEVEEGEEEAQDEGDFICATVKQFFEGVDTELKFATKRELMMWVYESTGHKALPIGVVKGAVPYIFARTTGKNTGLDSDVLLGISDDMVYKSKGNGITLDPDDEIVVFMIG